MRNEGFVGVTDNDWFAFLSRQPGIDEVNFWQPSGRTQFRSLTPSEPFSSVAGACLTASGYLWDQKIASDA